MVDLPSLGMEDVTVMDLIGVSTLAKRMFASSVLAARARRVSLAFFLRAMNYLPPFTTGKRPITGTTEQLDGIVNGADAHGASSSTTIATATNRPARAATAMYSLRLGLAGLGGNLCLSTTLTAWAASTSGPR